MRVCVIWAGVPFAVDGARDLVSSSLDFLLPWVFVSLSALPPVDSVSHTECSFEALSRCSLLEPCHVVSCWGEEVLCDVTIQASLSWA